MSPVSNRVALFLLLAGTFAIGFSPTLVRLSEIGPVATAVYRVALALPVPAELRSSSQLTVTLAGQVIEGASSSITMII